MAAIIKPSTSKIQVTTNEIIHKLFFTIRYKLTGNVIFSVPCE